MQLIAEHSFDDSHSRNYFQLYKHSIFISQQFNDVIFVQKAYCNPGMQHIVSLFSGGMVDLALMSDGSSPVGLC